MSFSTAQVPSKLPLIMPGTNLAQAEESKQDKEFSRNSCWEDFFAGAFLLNSCVGQSPGNRQRVSNKRKGWPLPPLPPPKKNGAVPLNLPKGNFSQPAPNFQLGGDTAGFSDPPEMPPMAKPPTVTQAPMARPKS